MTADPWQVAIDAWNERRDSAKAQADLISYQLQQACDYHGGDDDGPSLEQFLQLQSCLYFAFQLHKSINALLPREPAHQSLCGYLRLSTRLRSVGDMAMTPGVSWIDVDHEFWQLAQDMDRHWKEASAAVKSASLVRQNAGNVAVAVDVRPAVRVRLPAVAGRGRLDIRGLRYRALALTGRHLRARAR